MRASPIKNAFNAGELSEYAASRVDINKYAGACSLLRNTIPLTQGPAMRRPGTRFVKEVYDSTQKTWLAKFEFNYQQSYILEFSPGKIRFYTNHGILLDVDNQPYTVNTPFTADILTTAEGTFGLSLVQSNDIIYIATRSLPPHKLMRFFTSHITWYFTQIDIKNGPFLDLDKSSKTARLFKTENGHIFLRTGYPLFEPNEYYSYSQPLFYLQQPYDADIKVWEADKDIAIDQYRKNGNNNYISKNAAKTGYVSPIHNIGTAYDGNDGVKWQYNDSGFCVVKLLDYISNPCQVFLQTPIEIPLTLTNNTTLWAKAAWSNFLGYPTHVTFFRERLVFARDQKLWFSCAGDYENFATHEFGEVLTDSAIVIDIQSDDAAQITYLIPTVKGLIVGTTSGEVLVQPQTITQPFGPDNVQVSPSSGYGGRQVAPIRVDDSILFVQRGGTKIRETRYNYETESFNASDISVLAWHLTQEVITGMCMQREPYSILWLTTAKGSLLGLTYNKEQDVVAFHKHTFADGDLFIESAAVIPNPNGVIDDLWLVGKIKVNGADKRYVMYMEKSYESGDAQSTCFYVDCGSTYSGAPATTISGLNHLEGKTVAILADGAEHPDRIVTNGSITLSYPASTVQVGLRYHSIVRTMRIEAGAANGTAQGKTKRIDKVIVRLIHSLGLKIGAPELANIYNQNEYVDVVLREPINPMNRPTPLFTGDKKVLLPGGYNREGQITIYNDSLYPMIIEALMPQVDTYDNL